MKTFHFGVIHKLRTLGRMVEGGGGGGAGVVSSPAKSVLVLIGRGGGSAKSVRTP